MEHHVSVCMYKMVLLWGYVSTGWSECELLEKLLFVFKMGYSLELWDPNKAYILIDPLSHNVISNCDAGLHPMRFKETMAYHEVFISLLYKGYLPNAPSLKG